MASAYTELMEKYKDLAISQSIRSVLYWDIQTGKMPAKGLEHRSKQLGFLTRQHQQFWKSKWLHKLLQGVNTKDLEIHEARNVELIRRKHRVNRHMDDDLLANLSAHANKTLEIWKKAKAKSDFSIVKTDMKELFDLNHQYANKLADIKDQNSALDALIDERDEGLSAKMIKTYFKEAGSFLVPFLKKIAREPSDLSRNIRHVSLPRSEEERIAEWIAELFEYPISGENAKGNIDEVEHPLTITCGPNDVRITIKYGNYIKVINSTNHELGHAIHKLGKNPDWDYTPINHMGGPSMGECISRYTENKIGKSYEYYVNLFPELNQITSYRFNEISVDDFYEMISTVEPGPTRMTADEVTYGLHIIIRFELEDQLFNDQLSIEELPQAWNNLYDQYLGVEVKNDSVGVMQDLHWYSTFWGYFHGYFMGDLLGSQFHYSMEQDFASKYGSDFSWREELAAGSLKDVLKWHRENIHSKGVLYPALDHLKETTGESLNLDYFKSYLTAKYSTS